MQVHLILNYITFDRLVYVFHCGSFKTVFCVTFEGLHVVTLILMLDQVAHLLADKKKMTHCNHVLLCTVTYIHAYVRR